VLGRLLPARSGLPGEYGEALGQRNAALRRVAANVSSADALEPWTDRVAGLGQELQEARRAVLALLELAFAERAGELGLVEARLEYRGEDVTATALSGRLERDLERGATGLGPHLDDVAVLSAGRDLRLYGSQGEQRLAVLSLLLGEADLILERRGFAPLLLLDDVLSELDSERRRALAARISVGGQALVTATDAAFLPGSADLVLDVSPGEVRRR
jgi:DNA replication and repair protein RecF